MPALATARARRLNPYDRTASIGFLLVLGLLATATGWKAVSWNGIAPDCFWHLSAAARLQAEGIGRALDPLSLPPDAPARSPHSWLALLGMKMLWDRGGYRAAVAAQAGLQVMFVLAVALACRAARPASSPRSRFLPAPRDGAGDDGRSRLSSALAIAGASLVALPYLGFRPATALMVVTAICCWLLGRDRAAHERTRAVWLTVPLTAFAANLHPCALILPAWVAVLATGAAWERWVVAEPAERAEAGRRLTRYVALTVAVAAACCATPMRRGVVGALFREAADADQGLWGRFHTVWQDRSGRVIVTISAAAALCAACNVRKLRGGELLCLVVSAGLCARAPHFLPLLAMTAGPVLAVTMPRLPRPTFARPWAAALVVIGMTVGTWQTARAVPPLHHSLESWLGRPAAAMSAYPAGAAEFVAAHVTPRNGKLTCAKPWRGYLQWRLGERFQLDGPGMANATILRAGDDLARRELAARGWLTAYRDTVAVVMTAPAAPEGDDPASRTIVSMLFPKRRR